MKDTGYLVQMLSKLTFFMCAIQVVAVGTIPNKRNRIAYKN
jgi:hypothetical protein